MKHTNQQVALFDLGTATKNSHTSGKSVRLFSSSKSEDLASLGIKSMSDIRAELKAQGLKGNELSNQVRSTFFENLGVASVKAKGVEAAFEEAGAKVTGQRVSVSKTGTVRLTSVRSKWVPQTLTAEVDALAARVRRDQARIEELKANGAAITV
jgi:hypothetical protein